MLVCIGSQAIQYREPSSYIPKDIDLIGTAEDFSAVCYTIAAGYRNQLLGLFPIEDGKKLVSRIKINEPGIFPKILILECELTWPGSTAKAFQEIVINDPETIEKEGLLVPSLDLLYLLKMSHRYLKNSPHFLKTMNDIHHLRSLGAKIPEQYQEFYQARKKETYNYSHPKLNVKKADFFSGDGVTYVYDHDAIHEVVKQEAQPAYLQFKPPGSEVFCDRELFRQASTRTKWHAVLEEAYVLALERSQIPFRGQIDPKQSFEMALEKVCTSITSGWFREFAWENYYHVKDQYDPHYADKFFQKADQGLVKLYQGNS